MKVVHEKSVAETRQNPARLSVAMDMTFPARGGGGSAVYAYALFDALRRLDGLDLDTVGASGAWGLLGTLAWLGLRSRREIARGGAALLHCPTFVAPWRSPVPCVITIYDAAGVRFPHDYSLEWRLYTRAVLPSIARHAARIITLSRAARDDIMSCYHLDPTRIAVTYAGVDDIYFAPIDPAKVDVERQRLGQEGPIILFAGAPLRRKNLDVVLQALAGAAPSMTLSQARLMITGASAATFSDYVRTIEGLRLTQRVTWLGQVATERMPALYAAADLLVYPSLYEGFGFPPLEAMATGTPVVAANRSSLPEVLGNAALMIDPTDGRAFAEAAEAALANLGLRARLIAAGRQRAEGYRWQRCAEETAAVYRDTLACSTSRAAL